jgi:hypothetical protein
MYNTTNGGVALKNQNPGARLVQISAGGGEEDIWLEMTRNADIALFHNNTEMARTDTVANGGFFVNNTVTGGGFERALTTADLVTQTGVSSGPGTYVKTADQSRTNNTPLTDSVLATGTTLDGTSYYEFTCVLLFDSASATPNIRVGVSGTLATATGVLSFGNDEHSTQFGETTLGDATDAQGSVASFELDGSGPRVVILHGFVYWTAGGAGTQSFQVVWSQDTTNGTATTLLRGSTMRIDKIQAT